MFNNWFKNTVTEVLDKSSELLTRDTEKSYTLNEIIQEIHNSFYGEQDNLINWGNEKLSNETKKQALIDKAERLKKLGFTNSQEVEEAELEIQRLNKIEVENKQKEDFLDAVNYFGIKYPNMKVITFDSVKKLCEKYQKYGLIYGDVQYYKGTVPDKNLLEIEKCKDIEEDWSSRFAARYITHRKYDTLRILPTSEVSKFVKESKEYNWRNTSNGGYTSNYMGTMTYILEKLSLIIIAPKNDFKLENMEIKDFKLSEKIRVIEDPVVLIPLCYKENQYFGILSAWGGEEATDEIVVNQKFN